MKRLLSFLFLPLIAGPAVAEQGTRFTLGGGLTLPFYYGENDRPGFHFEGGVSVPLGSTRLAARLDALFSRTGHDGVPGNTRVVGGMAGLAYRFSTEGSVRPYVRAAVGLTNVRVSQLISNALQGSSKGSSHSYGETRPSFLGGVGLTIDLGRSDLFFESRVVHVDTTLHSTTFAPFTVGMAFGGK